MKRNYSKLFISLAFALLANWAMATNPSLAHKEGGETIQVALDTIPNDWENDLWLNTHFQRMEVGQTYRIIARRLPEIMENAVSPNITLPTFHYSVVEGSSVTVSATGEITATALGTSIIKVTYDEKEAYGETYGAVSPVNITYVAVDVVTDATDNSIGLTTDIGSTHYDTHYFFGKSIDFSFNVTTNSAENVTVKCNGKSADKSGTLYTIRLENRSNIVEISATKSGKTEKLYYVIDGRKIALNVTNATDANRILPVVGDKVRVSFKGITLPVYKLATIYNPQWESPSWGTYAAKVVYQNTTLGEIKSNINLSQWDLAKENTIEFTATQSGDFTFTDGKITESWWGDALGSELDKTGPGTPNLNADTHSGEFSALPAFRIQIAENTFSENAITLDLENTTTPESVVFNDKDIWSDTYTVDKPYIVSQIFSFSHLLSNNNWNGSYWDGFTISKSTDNSISHTEFPARQWGNMAQGGVAGKGTPYILAYNTAYLETQSGKKSTELLFDDATNNYAPQGVFVNNTAYVNKCIEDGFFVARRFVKDDTFILTAHALDSKKNYTGQTATFYLADYRADKAQNRILNDRWEWFDLTPLGECAGIHFTMKSSDAHPTYGDNTADYFALDRIVAKPIKSTNIDEITHKVGIDIYPNPTTDYIRTTTGGEITIYALNGTKLLQSGQLSPQQPFDVTTLSKGAYLVTVINNGKVIKTKLIKQ